MAGQLAVARSRVRDNAGLVARSSDVIHSLSANTLSSSAKEGTKYQGNGTGYTLVLDQPEAE